MRLNITQTLFAAMMLFGAAPANASVVNDPAGDYLATYAGSQTGDLDVITASVTYNPASDIFHFESTFAGAIGGSPSGFYILGFDRGAGTARFFANGLPNILFDSVVRFNMDGGGAVTLLAPTSGSTALAVGTANIQGKQLIADIAGSLLPSTGFAKTDYTWNLWPRDGALPGGFGQISDFAPDASNQAVQVVPLPGAFWLFGSVFAMFKLVGNRKRRFL
ncbi:hypothetical protein [Methylomonas albis]|uniref:PEP-CTERM sorting domain-containing protein n=1 Tax=Methylomonas albis TaxID=1854563 RepID=A0ABR9CUD0_9GAMM|nr:hypothetical protein [Methylomonas albis]MBD9354419.1 hypothetical protein [Methylomonas albis]